MPDGDVFGRRIDGCWKPAAAALMKDDPEPEEVEREVERGLKRFFKQWLQDRTDMIQRYAEALASLAVDLTPFATAHICERIDSMSRRGDFGERIVADAAKSLLTEGGSFYGGNLQKVAATLLKRSCELATSRGFISPAIAGALACGRFTQAEARSWGERLMGRVSLMADSARTQIENGAQSVRLRSTLNTPKVSTSDLMDDPLV